MSAPDRPVLTIREAAVHFGGVKAVDNISLTLRAGKIFGIIGPNGSGKSTLLAAITRLISLTHGSMAFDGQEYGNVPPSKVAHLGISRTFQTVRLLEDLTVRQNIELGADLALDSRRGLRHRRRARRCADDRVSEAVERTGLVGFERLRPGELSYGAQRRVEIARAIAMRPRLLLLDEPTAGMNRHERTEISELLKSLRDQQMTQLIVEHDVQLMVSTCDYLYGMNLGKLIAEGDPDAVVRDAAVQEAYLGRKRKPRA
jgi:branched-chain amino acid transport system ATP-binding protein